MGERGAQPDPIANIRYGQTCDCGRYCGCPEPGDIFVDYPQADWPDESAATDSGKQQESGQQEASDQQEDSGGWNATDIAVAAIGVGGAAVAVAAVGAVAVPIIAVAGGVGFALGRIFGK
jgi:hypothetical protein